MRARDATDPGVSTTGVGPVDATQVNIPELAFLLILGLLGTTAVRRRRRRFRFRQSEEDVERIVDAFERETGVLRRSEMMGTPSFVARESLREFVSFTLSRVDPSRPVAEASGLADRITDEFMAEHRDLFGMMPQMGFSWEDARAAVRPVIMFTLEHLPIR